MTKPEATGHLWLEEGRRRTGSIAEVAPTIPGFRLYHYAVPPELEASVTIGRRVRVPLGRTSRLVEAFVVGLDRGEWDSTLKLIDGVVDSESYLSAELVAVGREIAEHYACPLGKTLKAMIPEAVRKQRGVKSIRYAELTLPRAPANGEKRRLGPKQIALIEVMTQAGGPRPVSEILEQSNASTSVLRGLVKSNWVRITTRREVPISSRPAPTIEKAGYDLNADQKTAVELIHRRLEEARFSVTLLFGVSGSGKTEVYIHAIQHVLDRGRQAILLVPEIVLTTQLVRRIETRLPDVAVNHSGLTGTERSLLWRRIAAGEHRVVIGTRSAVFAPCPNLGLLCVDEEQETSYKNLQAPRFHVRDVAIIRAMRLGIPVVLGSATPAVETWYHSEHRPEYSRVTLPSRVRNLPIPKIHLVDMRDEFRERKATVTLSRRMEQLLRETLSRGEQAILLVNRRGFANRVFCPACKTKLTCPNCNVGLVMHRVSDQAICHYCRTRVKTPRVCPNPSCGEALVLAGIGTQRVEDVLAKCFPGARVQRVDSDTMRHRDQYLKIITDFEDRKIDVLVGTQMIAKGLDFPFVSFVGIVHADPGGFDADFRAHERMFQLVTQTAGRAGRADAPGRVVVQTTTPDLPAIQYALRHDYVGFVTEELRIRAKVGLPPFRRIARIVLSDDREEHTLHCAETMALAIREGMEALALGDADVLGPNPCVLSRLRGKYRYDLLIRTANASSLRRLLSHLNRAGALRTKASTLVVDVDPVALM